MAADTSNGFSLSQSQLVERLTTALAVAVARQADDGLPVADAGCCLRDTDDDGLVCC
jgi:hypothetical protein